MPYIPISKDRGFTAILVKDILDNAIIVVNGYAFNKCEKGYRIFSSLTRHVLVLSKDGDVIASSMDGIEEGIVKKYFEQDKEFLEDDE